MYFLIFRPHRFNHLFMDSKPTSAFAAIIQPALLNEVLMYVQVLTPRMSQDFNVALHFTYISLCL